MILICPHCKKRHDVDEKRIPANVKMARCKYCEQRFPIRPSEKAVEQAGEKVPEAKDGPRRISISLSKGGVGKTTTAVNLSMGLSIAGFKVLLVDTDTQGQVGFMLGVTLRAGLLELVTRELAAEDVLVQARERLWVLAGGKSLAGLKRLIDRKDFGGELTLTEVLAPLESRFDYIIVDTSPGWDPLIVNVLFYVNEVLTPVSLETMTLQGLVEFLKNLSIIQKYNKDISLKYVLPTFMDKRVKKSDSIMKKLEELYGEIICEPIRYNVRLSEAPAYGKSIYEFAPGSKGAKDYRRLVRRVAGDDELLR
ncbi:MAG: zinc-ribbon domain-containing protein [Desulfobulbaceae bacterium]|nr:zinc-ribbon domain-containing protein [Desulfobulbaceae bacterium]MCK5545528.1 zinc-ribbon domain-containing protein [Desulfobulbaceae bacterium]